MHNHTIYVVLYLNGYGYLFYVAEYWVERVCNNLCNIILIDGTDLSGIRISGIEY